MLKNLDWVNVSIYVIWPIIETILFIVAPRFMLSLIIAAGATLIIICENEKPIEDDQSWFY